MSIFFGVVSLILSILIPVMITIFMNFEVIHFSVFFIIPIGGAAIGYVCGYGYFKGLVKSNTLITGKHYLISIILSLICIFGITYTTYRLTCMDKENEQIIYSLDGDHISNYYVDGYGQMTFLNYNKYMIESTPISFSYKHRSLGEVSNTTACWIFAIIDYLGVLIGCLLVCSSQQDKPYCHTCKLYKKEKKLFRLPKDKGDKFFEELENSASKVDTNESIESIIDKFKTDEAGKNEEHYLCKVIYCENCQSASLSFKLYELKKNKLEENSKFDYAVDVDYNDVEKFSV